MKLGGSLAMEFPILLHQILMKLVVWIRVSNFIVHLHEVCDSLLSSHGHNVYAHQLIEVVIQSCCWSQNLDGPRTIANWDCKIPKALSTSFLAAPSALWKMSLTLGFGNWLDKCTPPWVDDIPKRVHVVVCAAICFEGHWWSFSIC